MPSRPISGNPRATAAILKSKILFVATTLSLTAVIFSTLIYIFYHFWSSLFQRSRTRPFEEIPPVKQLLRFTYKELKYATNGFNLENAIGKGGSGSVFRGILRDGKSVAVKLLDPAASLQAEKEFQNELTILGSIKSPLIVSLLGYCVYKNKRILVYEYMPNRSLQELLFCEAKIPGFIVLDWERRFQIIQNVCGALEFLHTECDPPVIHGDIKPSNVLLDWDFKAKVCDFGLSRLKVEAGEQFGDEYFSQEISPVASTSSRNGFLNKTWSFVSRESEAKSPKGKEASEELCSEVSKEYWWWKQECGSDELNRKDYVMEWIGSQICASGEHQHQHGKKMQDWWKQERLEEVKSKRVRKRDLNIGRCLEHMRKVGGRRREEKQQDVVSCCNTSMRGTLCYASPESPGGFLMEKSDIYSLGVLLLVIVSGRRPLNVLSPGLTMEKANLVSWCRHLAQSGDVLDLVDERLNGLYHTEQAALSINLALACLQRMPEMRPDIRHIVSVLHGQMDPPQLHFPFSPSPPCKLQYS